MEDTLIKYSIILGVFILALIWGIIKSSDLDIKTIVWIRFIKSFTAFIIAEILFFKFYRSTGYFIGFKLVGIIVIVFSTLDIPAKIVGIRLKRKLSFSDFSLNPFDKQIDKLGYKPLIGSLVILIFHFVGCSEINKYYNNNLNTRGIQTFAIVKQKEYKRIFKGEYDSVATIEYRYKGNLYSDSKIMRGVNIGDTIYIQIDSLDPMNKKILKR